MARKTNNNYMKISRELLSNGHDLSRKAILLYLWLNELEQRYTEEDGERDWFMKSDKELAKVSGMSVGIVKEAKKELREKGFIEVSRGGWNFKTTGKSSISQPTVYKLLK